MYSNGPPQSADMNPIEHVWSYLETKLRKRASLPANNRELEEALKEEWENIEVRYVITLYESMTRRVKALMDAKGGYTKY